MPSLHGNYGPISGVILEVRRRLVVMLGSVLVAACNSMIVDETTTSAPAERESTTTSVVTTTTLPTTTTSIVVATTTSLPLESEPIGLGPLAPRGGHSVVWTGQEVLVWGGEADELGSELFSDGAAFNPNTRQWRTIAESPLSPRRYHVAVWTGEAMLIVGGLGGPDGAAYDPASDSWRPISSPPIAVRGPGGVGPEGYLGAVWTGEELVVWLVQSDEVAAYDPDSDSWRVLPATEMDVDNGALRWDGENIYAFGTTVFNPPNTEEMSTSRFVGDEWERLPDTEFETQGFSALAPLTAWTGERFLAWGDSGDDGLAIAFDPSTDTWSATEAVVGAPCEAHGEPLAADGVIFTFSWCSPSIGMYDAETNTWSQATVGGSPTARYTVWTGDKLINWGDTCCYGAGGRPFTTQAWIYTPES